MYEYYILKAPSFLLNLAFWKTFEKLKLPSLFAAWLFRTFHNKSHNKKSFVIHSKTFVITISPTYLFLWKKWTFVGPCELFWSIFVRKTPHSSLFNIEAHIGICAQFLGIPCCISLVWKGIPPFLLLMLISAWLTVSSAINRDEKRLLNYSCLI